jgi:hypothetical protein
MQHTSWKAMLIIIGIMSIFGGYWYTKNRVHTPFDFVSQTSEDELKDEESAILEKKSTLRTLKEIVTDLKKPIPERVVKTRKQGGATVRYISWITCMSILDYYADGWQYRIDDYKMVNDKVFVISVSLGIPTSDYGMVWRAATGVETYSEKMFGDICSNGSSMALRRAAAAFGLRSLYPN